MVKGLKLRENMETSRREYLAKIHLSAQIKTTALVGPAALIVIFFVLIYDNCWQIAVVFSAMCAAQIGLIAALIISRHKKSVLASYTTLLTIMSFVTVANIFVKGMLPAAVITYIASIIHASLYSRRVVKIGIIYFVIGYVLCELVQYFEPFEMMELTPPSRLLVVITLVLMMFSQLIVYIFQAHEINRRLTKKLTTVNAEQEAVIVAVDGVQPAISEAVNQIDTISTAFAAQANEQAASTMEMGATVTEAMQITSQTARNALDAELIADKTRLSLQKNNDLYQEVERGFQQVVSKIDNAHTEITTLVEQVERIEGILQINRTIGEHIKVLAVNAAIEAARAGEAGRGFQVVASELREMIHSTDENLSSSHNLLEEIRVRSRESSAAIKEGSEQLGRYYDSLRVIGEMIFESAQGFSQTAEQVKQISIAAGEQKSGMQEMNSTMRELELAAGELSHSALDLQKAVSIISNSQDLMRGTLK